jgi:hypothetical protein
MPASHASFLQERAFAGSVWQGVEVAGGDVGGADAAELGLFGSASIEDIGAACVESAA